MVPQVKPAPKAERMRLSPLCSWSSHSYRQSGMVAEVVFPYFWMLIITLAGSSPIRLAVASMVVTGTSTSIAALAWSPQQVVVSLLGETEAHVQIHTDQESYRPGVALAAPQWNAGVADGVEGIIVWNSLVSLGFNDDVFQEVFYYELSMPSAQLAGNVELVGGRWPSGATPLWKRYLP